jgi:hypothetical protein
MIPSFSSLPSLALRGLAPALLVGVLLGGSVPSGSAQEVSDSLAGEKAAEAAKKQEIAPNYNLYWGPVSFQLESAVHVEFTDNVLNAGVNRSSDEIIRPAVELRSYWPITDLNALTLSLGVGYEYYVKNTVLNVDSPLISPDSEIALVLYVKNLRFRFHEAFSYQESLYYGASYSQQSGQFINLQNLGTFGRIENLAGLAADWDLGAFVLPWATTMRISSPCFPRSIT